MWHLGASYSKSWLFSPSLHALDWVTAGYFLLRLNEDMRLKPLLNCCYFLSLLSGLIAMFMNCTAFLLLLSVELGNGRSTIIQNQEQNIILRRFYNQRKKTSSTKLLHVIIQSNVNVNNSESKRKVAIGLT